MSPLTVVPPAVRCLWRRAVLRHVVGVGLLVGAFWTAGLVFGLGTGEAQAAENVNVVPVASSAVNPVNPESPATPVTAVQDTAVDVGRSAGTAEAEPPDGTASAVSQPSTPHRSPEAPAGSRSVALEAAGTLPVRPGSGPRTTDEAAESVRQESGTAVSKRAEGAAKARHSVERAVSGHPEAPAVVAPVARSLERLPGVVGGTVGALPLVPAVELPQVPAAPGGGLPGGGAENPHVPSGPDRGGAVPDDSAPRAGQLPGAEVLSYSSEFTTADRDGPEVRPGTGHHAPPAPRLPHPAAGSSSGDAGSSRTAGDSAGAFFHLAAPGSGVFGPDSGYGTYPTRERHREIPEFPG